MSKKSVNINLDSHNYDKLVRLAAQDERPQSYVINRLIEQWPDDQPIPRKPVTTTTTSNG